MNNKNIILFVDSAPGDAVKSLRAYSQKHGKNYRIGIIREKKPKPGDTKSVDVVISCDFKRDDKIIQALKPYEGQILALVCRGEKHIADYARLVPFLPYVRTPNKESLIWATDKVQMREKLMAYDKTITPRFTVVKDAGKNSVKKIKEEVGFPLVVKPAGLASSLLVSICFHEEELAETLSKIFRKIKSIYKENKRKEEPRVLVEQFMDGEMYSIDAYVDSRGHITQCPIVHVKTGRTIGFDDFFNYSRITPTTLTKEEVAAAEAVAVKSIYALGLRSATAHIELMHCGGKFRIIELGPRIGGFRPKMYELSYGINHALNDVLVRIPKKLNVPKKIQGYTAVLKFYPRKEGRIKKISGVKRVKELKSLVSLAQNKKVGDLSKFAKNGGKSVFDLTLFNKTRPELLADIRRAEKHLLIET